MNITQIKRANACAGHCYFSTSTMKFFNSKVHGPVYGDGYFVTSEQVPYNPRRYTVRHAMPDGGIETVGTFGAYGSLRSAQDAAREASKEKGE